jgi:multidrug resistance efflux pump
MKLFARHKFAILWLAAALTAGVVYLLWNVHANFLGIVETRTHKLGSQEDGRISQIKVALGDEVHANQILAALDETDLLTERNWLTSEIQRLESLMDADKARYALEYEKLRLQRDASASGVDVRRADLEAKRAELQALEAEIERLTNAEQAGLGRARDLSSLVMRRDTAARFIKEQDMATGDEGRRDRLRSSSRGNAEADSVILSMLNGRVERLNELKLKLANIERRMDRRHIISPCDGRVVNINYLQGDAVKAFATIVTVEEPGADFVDAYVPETSGTLPTLGQRVTIYPHRVGNVDAHGTVVFIDPGYSAIPERLAFRKLVYWARKFRVKLDTGHHLMPGEAAEVELLNETAVLKEAHAAPPPQKDPAVRVPEVRVYDKGALSEVKVSNKLRKKSSVEPSGIAWLPDIERYVIASDDTSRRGHAHAPWLLLMDARGELEKKPVEILGIDKANDLESIATAPDGSLYMVSSQSVSKQEKRPASRQQLLKVKRAGRDLSVVGVADILAALSMSYKGDDLHGLGLGDIDGDGQLVLNIEGAAWKGRDLLLGLKQPRPADGALIWRLENPDGLLEHQRLEPGQLTLFGRADLRTPDGRPAAISDLVVDDRGDLYALSTISSPPSHGQMGGMHRLVVRESGTLQTIPLFAFPHLKPEGLCSLGNGRFTIVFDTDDELPIPYLNVEVPKS